MLTVVGQALGLPWIEIKLADSTIGWVSSLPKYVRIDFDVSSLPIAYFRPPTGIISETWLGEALGTLTIENGSIDDAAVVVTNERDLESVVFVRAGDDYTTIRIPDGRYVVFFTTGAGWDGQRFNQNAEYMRFEDPLYFTTTPKAEGTFYSTWTLTLQPVPFGTAKTITTRPDQFPSIQTPPSTEQP